MEELQEYLFFHNNLSDEEKLEKLLIIEKVEADILKREMNINFIPTWSKKLQK